MLKFIKRNNRLDIEHSKGDRFVFGFECEENIAEGCRLRLQISPNGNTNDIIIEKYFELSSNSFYITLTETEENLLSIDEEYQYRFTFFDVLGNKITNISGILIVKWGV